MHTHVRTLLISLARKCSHINEFWQELGISFYTFLKTEITLVVIIFVLQVQKTVTEDIPIESVGMFLKKLLEKEEIKQYVLPMRAIVSSQSLSSDFGGIIHAAIGFSHSQLIKLLINTCKYLPENYDILYCGPLTTAQEIKSFMKRCSAFNEDRVYYILDVSNLNYDQQEVRFTCHNGML